MESMVFWRCASLIDNVVFHVMPQGWDADVALPGSRTCAKGIVGQAPGHTILSSQLPASLRFAGDGNPSCKELGLQSAPIHRLLPCHHCRQHHIWPESSKTKATAVAGRGDSPGMGMLGGSVESDECNMMAGASETRVWVCEYDLLPIQSHPGCVMPTMLPSLYGVCVRLSMSCSLVRMPLACCAHELGTAVGWQLIGK
eukprot:2478898-Amphidinium_carterae.3